MVLAIPVTTLAIMAWAVAAPSEPIHPIYSRLRSLQCDDNRDMQRGTMNYLLSILIIAALASQATIWHSLATIRDAIQQTNAIILAACGSDPPPLKWSDLRYVFDIKEDCNGKEAIQA